MFLFKRKVPIRRREEYKEKRDMSHSSDWWLLSVAIFIFTTLSQTSQSVLKIHDGLKTEVFLSPKFELEPGSVSNKFYYDIGFPRGHIAIKKFDAEVVDEAGNSIPLHETYLHHWLVVRYFLRRGVQTPNYNANMLFQEPNHITVRNSGVCGNSLPQYFGLGSETRKTETKIPEPYGLEVGNLADIPEGYEEKWMLNVHAIDTRGAEDRLGCTECRCDLYNVTEDEYGKAIEHGYIGGLRCCYDSTRCRVKEGFPSIKRRLYLKYTVTYVNWEPSILPVKIYIFDVTDTWKKWNDQHHCKIEFGVEPCETAMANSGCIHTKGLSLSFPSGGDVIYGVAHQHTGGIGSTLFGEDGRVICSSLPIYGEGTEPGNEAGYIVGMTTCYPRPGTVKIAEGETLTIVSNYSSHQSHTGVMGLFYILVADPIPDSFLHSQNKSGEMMIVTNAILILALVGIAVAGVAVVISRRRGERENGYESIVM